MRWWREYVGGFRGAWQYLHHRLDNGRFTWWICPDSRSLMRDDPNRWRKGR